MANNNTERFLNAFNNIHDYIKRECGSNGHLGFTEGLNKLRNKNFILEVLERHLVHEGDVLGLLQKL